MASRLSLLSDRDIDNVASFDITETLDLHDPRFGSAGCMSFQCPTCKMQEDECIGHFASLSLGCYIFNPLVYNVIEDIINSTCITCSEVLNRLSTRSGQKSSRATVCMNCNSTNYCNYKIISEHVKKADRTGKKKGPHAATRCWTVGSRDVRTMYIRPDQIIHILPSGYVLSKILVPPIHLRTPEDVEWSSDMQKYYNQLVQAIRVHPGNAEAALFVYEKIVGSGGIMGMMSGKEGIFRKIMMGKRLECSARAVISPDPCISIDEVAIPNIVADAIRIPCRVTEYNVAYVKELAYDKKLWWDPVQDHVALSRHVLVGMKFYRALENGDFVLFNRQPSLSRESIMCFRIKLKKDDSYTFGMNPQVVSPFNADFDGDEMNIFFIYQAAEMLELCHVSNNITVDGKTVLVPVQDVVTGCYMMSLSDQLVDIKVWQECMMHVLYKSPTASLYYENSVQSSYSHMSSRVNGVAEHNLVEASGALEKPQDVDEPAESYSKTLKNFPLLGVTQPTIIRKTPVTDISCGAKASRPPELLPSVGCEHYVKTNDYVSGINTTHNILKSCVPGYDGKIITKNVLVNIIKDIDGHEALRMLETLQHVVVTWLSNQGLTVPLRSVVATPQVYDYKSSPDVFQEACQLTVERELGNSQLLYMIKSGAKGSIVHAAHMAISLGQQYVNGKPSMFCNSSYCRGLKPDEFFGHQMAAREGVVRTGVNTAHTGYLNRRVCKIVADMRYQYNGTIADDLYVSSFPST